MIRRLTVVGLLVSALLGAALVTPAAASQTYYPGAWNGYKIYLSPSSQTGNIGCDGFNEATFAMNTAFRAVHEPGVEAGFLSRGYQVRIGTGTVNQRIADSNSYAPRYHIALHSNATTGCPGSRGGTETYNYHGNVSGSFLAQEILNFLGPRSPGTGDKRVPRTDLAELYATTSTAVYLESAFHDFPPDEDWLRTYDYWAWLIAMCVDIRLGYP